MYVRAYGQPPWNERNEPEPSERYLRWVISHPNTYCLVAPAGVTPGVEAAGGGTVDGFVLAGARAYADFQQDWERMAERPPEGWPVVAGRLGYIWEIAVDPDAQRRGTGSALLGAAVSMLRAIGVERVLLRSSERAPAAVALYRRFGFQRLPLRERIDPLAGPWLLDL